MAFPPFPVIIIIAITPIVIAKSVIFIEYMFQGIYISKIIPGGAAAATGISTNNSILASPIMMKMREYRVYENHCSPQHHYCIDTNNSILAALIMMMGIFLSLAFAYISFYFCQYLVKNETKKKK